MSGKGMGFVKVICEWVPSEAIRSTVLIWGRPDGWVERVEFLPGRIRNWNGRYVLPASREITEYLEGRRTTFSHRDKQVERIRLLRGSFHQAALLRAMEIPYGETATYSDIARSLSSRAWRAVGHAMSLNPIPILVPCHRVVAKHGLGGFSGQVWLKRKLLELESARLA